MNRKTREPHAFKIKTEKSGKCDSAGKYFSAVRCKIKKQRPCKPGYVVTPGRARALNLNNGSSFILAAHGCAVRSSLPPGNGRATLKCRYT